MDPLELSKEMTSAPEETVKETQVTSQPQPEATGDAPRETPADTPSEAQPAAPAPQPDGQVEVQPHNEPAAAEKKPATDYASLDRAALVEALREAVNREVQEAKEDVELIKQYFYKKLNQELEEKRKALAEEDDADEAALTPEKDELEATLKSLLGDFKAKKAAYAARLEQERENNLLQKQHLLEQMNALTESTDDATGHISEFKDMQQQWKTIGPVPAPMANDLWKQYNAVQEKFWDLVKINNELREYDFKKNLETKVKLCEAAEKLLEEADIVAAARRLQKLHEEWREVGPVAREMREEIWSRFKKATAEINKKQQSYFDALHQNEEENLAKKEALCEKLEAIRPDELKTYAAWDTASQTVKGLQEEWRAIGFGPRKSNQQVFERYRKACDEFFAKKMAFYKTQKAETQANVDKKRALCEQAEALKDSTDWKATTDKLIALQSEWKQVGPVPRRHSEELWKRFSTACDHFFEQKHKNTSTQRSEEQENLKKKKEIIARIDELDTTDAPKAHAALKQLIEDFRNAGHVPFKDKDKVYKAYRAAIDKQFDALNIDASNRRLETFRSNLEDMTTQGEQKLHRERDKMVRAYEHLKAEIATYENNMGFLSASSKKGNSILKEMERKIEGLKEECRLLEQKINLIEDRL